MGADQKRQDCYFFKTDDNAITAIKVHSLIGFRPFPYHTKGFVRQLGKHTLFQLPNPP